MKSILIRLKEGDYDKLKSYSKNHQRSLASTCRYALSKLFDMGDDQIGC